MFGNFLKDLLKGFKAKAGEFEEKLKAVEGLAEAEREALARDWMNLAVDVHSIGLDPDSVRVLLQKATGEPFMHMRYGPVPCYCGHPPGRHVGGLDGHCVSCAGRNCPSYKPREDS